MFKNATHTRYEYLYVVPVAPVVYQVVLDRGIGQVREFEPRLVHTRVKNRRDFFLCAN